MPKHLSKAAATIGVAVGIAVIGGSVIGGIALAMDEGPGSRPAVTEVADVTEPGDGSDQAGQRDDDTTGNPDASSSIPPSSSGASYDDDDADDGTKADRDHEDEDEPDHDYHR